jgi:predicted nucleic acid-binding Zn ribbon protein
MPRPKSPEECANCGAAVPRGARACPECGADERTGWREQSVYDGLDLPEEAFGDESEPHARRQRRAGLSWYWVATAVLLIALFVAGFVVFG